MKVTLIRHTSVDVPPGTCYGWTDVPVKESFAEEAAITKGNIDGLMFDAIYTSPLTRCVRLATFCGYPDAVRDSRLKELNSGEWEMKRYAEITDLRIQEWYKNYMHYVIPGGESFMQLLSRVSSFMDELYKKPFHRVAVFAHGGVILAAQLYAGVVVSDEKAFSNLLPYGGVTEIELND